MKTIELVRISKTYRTRRETPGAWGFITQFFSPTFTEHHALSQVGFSIEPGECVGLLGPNGAGKSTLVKILCGIQQPTHGTVTVLGFNPATKPIGLLRSLGVIFGHKTSLWWDLPLKDSFQIAQAIYHIEHSVYRKNLEELLTALSLTHLLTHPPRTLSLGERVKAELAMILLHEPAVLLLDEPTVGLDLSAKQEIRDYLNRRCKERHTSIVLTSHDLRDIAQCCERVLLLNRGHLAYDGSTSNLIQEYVALGGQVRPDAAGQSNDLEAALLWRFQQWRANRE